MIGETDPVEEVGLAGEDSSPKPGRARWRARLVCRAGVLAGFAAVVLLWPVAVAWLIPALSPHVAAGHALGRRAVTVASLCGLPALVLVGWKRRWLCRWVCPVGLVLEGCGTLRRRKGRAFAYRGVPPIGQWLVLTTLAGAAGGLPLFLWLDPLAIFSGAFEAARAAVTLASVAGALGLAGLVVLSTAWPGLWCRKLCPLGGLQEYLATLVRRGRSGQTDDPASVRARRGRILLWRDLLCTAGGFGASVGILRLFAPLRRGDLRPPGTIDPIKLAAQCIRCGNCGRVCPSGIVRQSLRVDEPHLLLTPRIRLGEDYCREDCHACTQSCPSGAIERLSLDEKNDWPIGLARIHLADCHLTHEIECGHCARICPRNAIIEGFSENTWTADVRVDAAKCNGCGACVPICPPKVITIDPIRT